MPVTSARLTSVAQSGRSQSGASATTRHAPTSTARFSHAGGGRMIRRASSVCAAFPWISTPAMNPVGVG